MNSPETAAPDGRSRPFALGGQGVKPRFGSDKAGAAKGFSLNGGLAAVPAAPAKVTAEVAPDPAEVAAEPPPPIEVGEEPRPAAMTPKTGAAKAAGPAEAVPRDPVGPGTKILNTSLPAGLFAALDDASSAWFAANGALARQSGARKSLNTFTVAVLTFGLQAVKDSAPEDVAVLFPPIRR